MPVSVRKWFIPITATALLVLGLFYAFWPRAVPVELGTVIRGPMVVTIDDEGVTRVKEAYLVSAPLPGRVLRFDGHVGDTVSEDTSGNGKHAVAGF